MTRAVGSLEGSPPSSPLLTLFRRGNIPWVSAAPARMANVLRQCCRRTPGSACKPAPGDGGGVRDDGQRPFEPLCRAGASGLAATRTGGDCHVGFRRHHGARRVDPQTIAPARAVSGITPGGVGAAKCAGLQQSDEVAISADGTKVVYRRAAGPRSTSSRVHPCGEGRQQPIRLFPRWGLGRLCHRHHPAEGGSRADRPSRSASSLARRKLNREVALKILPDAFATDPDRYSLARCVQAVTRRRCSRQPQPPQHRRHLPAPVSRWDAAGCDGFRLGSPSLWVYDVVSAAGLRLTQEGAALAPLWTPDGERVVFSWNVEGVRDLYWTPADGSGEIERLTTSDVLDIPTSVTPDGHAALFARIDGEA